MTTTNTVMGTREIATATTSKATNILLTDFLPKFD